MNEVEQIRLLLVEDDEQACEHIRSLLHGVRDREFLVEWCRTAEAGRAALRRNQHDLCLLARELDSTDGLELLRGARAESCLTPVVLLSRKDDPGLENEAAKAGAEDCLLKPGLESFLLGRTIRHVLERKRATAVAAFEHACLAAFGTEVGLAVTRRDTLSSILRRCAALMVRYLNVHVAQIWVVNPDDGMLHLKASSGAVDDVDLRSAPVTCLKPDSCCSSDGKPVLATPAAGDPRVPWSDWVLREVVVSYAGYPLMLESRLVGLMAVFALQPLPSKVVEEMGSVANGIGLCIDLKRSERQLDASEIRYRSVVETLKEVVFQVNESGHWTALNPAWTDISGFSINETLGSLFLEFIHHDDRQRNRFIFLQLMERKLDFCRYETRLLTKDGKFRWVEVYAQLSFNSDGSILGASGSLTDITDRKRAEQEIQKLAAFPQVNPNPVLEFDGEGKVTYFNEAAAALARSLGQTQPLAILPPDSREIARRCLATGNNNLRREITMAGRTISWSFFPIVASGVVHCYGSDITETLNLEAQFRHSQKLESVGQLAAGVAHDFNNILTIIQGYADSLLTRSDAEPGFSGPLKQISDASKRASALTRQLLMFSRKQAIQLKVLDLNGVLRNLSNLLSRLLGEHIMIESQFAPDLPAIEADTGMMEQIVMNLAVNARDAMPKGGRLVISTSAADISPEYVRRHPKAVEGRAVRLTVRDTGCGMNRATLSRIFEPFFSTKEVGKGTGLGLATVYGIVTQHRGWIDVNSEVDVGTTFEIFLPVAAAGLAPTTEAPPPVTGAAAKGGSETILLVEDEPTLRELVREILSDHGYRVVEAGSGIEALKVWGQLGGRVDLLLTDMVMPEGITGRELALQLKSRDPALKIVFTSGYSTELMTKDPELLDVPLLSKPYLPPQLIQLVRTCLDAPPRAHSTSSGAS